MSSPFPYDIPPEGSMLPTEHSDPDVDIIIKLLKAIDKFVREYIESHLPYLVHDGLQDLVPDFRNQIPILSSNTQNIISILSDQQPLINCLPVITQSTVPNQCLQ